MISTSQFSRLTDDGTKQIVANSAGGATIGTSPISDSLKRRRRAAASALNKPAVSSYVSHLDVETTALIRDILNAGGAGTKAIAPMALIQRCALSIVMTVSAFPSRCSACTSSLTVLIGQLGHSHGIAR